MNMNKIKRIKEFLKQYETLDPNLKQLVSSCRDDYIRQLYKEYAKNGIENYQMKPNQNEINALNEVFILHK